MCAERGAHASPLVSVHRLRAAAREGRIRKGSLVGAGVLWGVQPAPSRGVSRLSLEGVPRMPPVVPRPALALLTPKQADDWWSRGFGDICTATGEAQGLPGL